MNSPRKRRRPEQDRADAGTQDSVSLAENENGVAPAADAHEAIAANDGSLAEEPRTGVVATLPDVLPSAEAAQAPLDADDQGTRDLDRAALRRGLESLIFVSDRVVTAVQLARALKVRVAVVRGLLSELKADYADRGIQLVEVAGGYQFRTSPASAIYVREYVAQKPVRLTRAQLETLALIAYRQPVTRPEIDEIRGVDSGSALRVLLERALIKMLGRKDEPGRPVLYGTASAFLEFFGLGSLQELPTLREFTELSTENRALFKRKTGEDVLETEAALAAEEEAARVDDDGTETVSDDELAALAAEASAADEQPPLADDNERPTARVDDGVGDGEAN